MAIAARRPRGRQAARACGLKLSAEDLRGPDVDDLAALGAPVAEDVVEVLVVANGDADEEAVRFSGDGDFAGPGETGTNDRDDPMAALSGGRSRDATMA